MGLSNTFATIPGIVVPSLIGALTYQGVSVLIRFKGAIPIDFRAFFTAQHRGLAPNLLDYIRSFILRLDRFQLTRIWRTSKMG